MNRRLADLRDVANLAQVSVATASRALNHPHLVKDTTRLSVLEAADKLGYVVHGAGRALSSRRTRTVGAVLPSLDNAIFSHTAQSLQKTLGEYGYMLLIACNEFSLDEEIKLTKMLLERGVDGLVFTGLEHEPDLFSLVKNFQIPYVLTWAFDETDRHPCVGFNSRKSGMIIAEHLTRLGHREFGVITAFMRGNERQRDRVDGIRQYLESREIPLPQTRIVETSFSLQNGRAAAKKLMRDGDPPTAIICGNDVLAVGAIAELRDMGYAVPEDISITGCENLDISSHISPPLTTIGWCGHDLGRFAADCIVSQIQNRSWKMQIEVPLELFVRETTAPPRYGVLSDGHGGDRLP